MKLVEAPLDLYRRIPVVEFRTHHTILVLPTCKGSGLVVELQVKPC
jgi:hypothetical protein